MQTKITIFLFLNLLGYFAYGQGEFKTNITTANGIMEFGGDSLGKPILCNITPAMSKQIEAEIANNQAALRQAGKLPSSFSTAVVNFSFPLRKKAGFTDPGYYTIGNYIDRNAASGAIQDYNCGARTYDGHNGTDIGISPFPWYKMDNNQVEVIAGAAGIIVSKTDGNYDRQCLAPNANWNAIYVQHSDGTVAWYGHLKSGSLTTKNVGDAVVAGEFLGVVGSSGMSTGPHLHFELRSSTNAVIDPWNGSCNSTASRWISQEPYYNSGINKIMTGNGIPSTQCSSDTLRQATSFCGGDLVYLAVGFRDQQNGQVVTHQLVQPNNTIFQQWTQNFSSFSSDTWYWWNWYLPNPAQAGTWKYRVTYLGNIYETNFTVTSIVTPTVTITRSPSGAVNPTSSVTFTAANTNGGTAPIYQWKKNNVNVGTNSSTYTNASWVNGDIVKCVMTSNKPCITSNTATSNSLTITTKPKYMTVDIVSNKAYYYDASFTYLLNHTMSSTVMNGVTNASDVTVVGSYAYVLDQTNKRVFRSSASGTIPAKSKTLKTNTGASLSTPTGITISGDSLWILDKGGKAIYRYSLASAFAATGSLNAAAKIALNTSNSTAESIIGSGGYFYVLNNGTTKKIYRYTKSGSGALASKTLLTTTGGALNSISGLVLDGSYLRVVDKGIDYTLKYSLSSLFSATGSLNASSSNILNSGNTNVTGITLVSTSSLLRVADPEPIVAEEEIHNKTFDLLVYPNPSSSLITVQLNGEISGSALIQIFDYSGKLMSHQNLQEQENYLNNEVTFDISTLSSGIYIIKASDNVNSQSKIIERY